MASCYLSVNIQSVLVLVSWTYHAIQPMHHMINNTLAGNNNLFDERLRKKGSIFLWFYMWYDWRKWFFIWSGDFGPKYGEEISLEIHNHIDAILFQSSGSKVVIQIGEPCINPNALMIRVWWHWRLKIRKQRLWTLLESFEVKDSKNMYYLVLPQKTVIWDEKSGYTILL